MNHESPVCPGRLVPGTGIACLSKGMTEGNSTIFSLLRGMGAGVLSGRAHAFK